VLNVVRQWDLHEGNESKLNLPGRLAAMAPMAAAEKTVQLNYLE
jgi:hypothetical protein